MQHFLMHEYKKSMLECRTCECVHVTDEHQYHQHIFWCAILAHQRWNSNKVNATVCLIEIFVTSLPTCPQKFSCWRPGFWVVHILHTDQFFFIYIGLLICRDDWEGRGDRGIRPDSALTGGSLKKEEVYINKPWFTLVNRWWRNCSVWKRCAIYFGKRERERNRKRRDWVLQKGRAEMMLPENCIVKKRGEWHSLVKSHVTLYSWAVCWVNGAPDLLSLFAVQLTEHIESRLLKSRYRFPAAPLNSACRPHGVWINAPASLMHTLLSIMAPSTSLHQISGSTMQLAHTDQYSSCYVYRIYTSTNSEHFGI